jgi:hypothetical protein
MTIRVDSSKVEQAGPPVDGGSIPTSALQLRKKDWEVARVDKAVAEQMIEQHHYAKGASNTAVAIHGLYPRGWMWYSHCVGVAWWIPPTKSAAQAWAGERWQGVLSLSRLVIEPEVPKNACSFLLSKSVKMIDPKQWHTLVTYADSWRGHDGMIYEAAGWERCGETKPEAVYTINGRMVARKAGQKTRTHSQMIELGAVLVGRFPKSRFRLVR